MIVLDQASDCIRPGPLGTFPPAAMLQKGVPVLKKKDGSRVFIRLDPAFRELQAKKNVIGLDAPLTCWMR